MSGCIPVAGLKALLAALVFLWLDLNPSAMPAGKVIAGKGYQDVAKPIA
jgi:hypothetical protein